MENEAQDQNAEQATESVENNEAEATGAEELGNDVAESNDDGGAAEAEGNEDDSGQDGSAGQPGESSASHKADPMSYVLQQNARLQEELLNVKQTANKETEAAKERQLLQLMTPEERIEYTTAKQLKIINDATSAASQKTQFIVQDASDKAEFISNIAGTPLAKYQADVEKMYNTLIQQGKYVKRDVLLDVVIGQKTRAAMKKGVGTKQKANGQKNINAAKTTGGAVKNDMRNAPKRNGSGNSVRDLEARLAGKNILASPWGNA